MIKWRNSESDVKNISDKNGQLVVKVVLTCALSISIKNRFQFSKIKKKFIFIGVDEAQEVLIGF